MATIKLPPTKYRIKWNNHEIIIDREVDGYAISTCGNAYCWHDIDIVIIPYPVYIFTKII